MKNIKKILLSLFIFTLCFSTTIFAAEYEIKDYKIEANVNEDGSLNVVEYLKYYFEEDMNGLLRDIMYKYNYKNQKNDMSATSSRYQASGVENIRVYTSDSSFENMNESYVRPQDELSNGMNNVHSIAQTSGDLGKVNIKVYTPVNAENYKYVKYEYTLNDVIVKYNDYAELFWNFVGGDWECHINNLEIYITVPASEEIIFFGHTYADIGFMKTKDNKIKLNVESLPSETAVDSRVVFPNTNLGNVTKTINENYNFDELSSIEAQEGKNKENYHLSNKLWVVYAIFSTITFIFLIIKASSYGNKNKKSYKKVEHYTDLPNIYSLGDYNCIKNMYFGYSDTNLLVATILDLSNRKYIKLEAVKKAKILKDTYEYYLSTDRPEKLDDLTTYEKELLNYIFNKRFDDKINVEEFANNKFELNERFKELGLKYSVAGKFRKACADRTNENMKKMYNPVPKIMWKIYLVSLIMSVIFGAFIIFGISPLTDKGIMIFVVSFVTLFIFGMLALIIETAGKSLKDEYIDEYNKLVGLEKYLKEYSLIKDRFPIELVLWEKYLVFASLFGIADKVAKEFKEELLSKGYDEDYIYTMYPIIHIGMNTTSFTSSAASATGSSSSGGYSGGGSGGGGRRWRRRWSLLNQMYVYKIF